MLRGVRAVRLVTAVGEGFADHVHACDAGLQWPSGVIRGDDGQVAGDALHGVDNDVGEGAVFVRLVVERAVGLTCWTRAKAFNAAICSMRESHFGARTKACTTWVGDGSTTL